MGNHISFRPPDGKIVHWDGSVQEFYKDKPLTVAELMLDHPQQLVVEFHSAFNQRRPTPLPADKKLDVNKIYLMLPMKRGKPVRLNAEESRRILLIVNSLWSSSRFLPWLARICHASTIGEEVLQQKKEQKENTEERYVVSEFMPETLEGRPEYLSRQLSGKAWNPSLDTIKEKKIERKISHWLFVKTF